MSDRDRFQPREALSAMDVAEGLRQKLQARSAVVAVIGAGYVGLPAAVEAARAGFQTVAIDLNADRVAQINAGRSYIDDVADADLQALAAFKLLQATTDFDALQQADVVLICVPTPLTPNRDPDLTFVVSAAREVAARLHAGQLICLESTTYPGTTEELLAPMLCERGLQVGTDFFLCYCPERVDPGNQQFSFSKLVRVVGGVTPVCTELASLFYTHLAGGLVAVSSPRVAEMTKLFENIYRAVNIALVNEMALLCDRMGLDVWEVMEAAASKPYGIQPFKPGPGVGGHCIPLDPLYLAWKARAYDFALRSVQLADEVNSSMPYFVVQKLARLLNDAGKPLKGARVLLLGVAYKKDVADSRESPALRVIELLQRAGARVIYHDPLIPTLTPHGGLREAMSSHPLSAELLSSHDAVVVATDHSGVDYGLVVAHAPLVLDTRGVTRSLHGPNRHLL